MIRTQKRKYGTLSASCKPFIVSKIDHMAIPPAGTFNYAGVVPAADATGPWQLHDQSSASSYVGEERLFRDRLVGLHPFLEIADAGLTPDTRRSEFTGNVRPRVLLSRLTLRASSNDRASRPVFSFCLDRSLLNAFRPGDTLHLARTECGGLGLSLIRHEQLVFAVGAVTAVPHGVNASLRFPGEAIRQAEHLFREIDPSFRFRELPLELRVGSERRILYRGRPTIGDYNVFVEHGYYLGFPGIDECAAIWLAKGCPEVPAIASAQLLEYPDLSTIG